MNINQPVKDVNLYVGKDSKDTYFWLVPVNAAIDRWEEVDTPNIDCINAEAAMTTCSMLDLANVLENGVFHVNEVVEFDL